MKKITIKDFLKFNQHFYIVCSTQEEAQKIVSCFHNYYEQNEIFDTNIHNAVSNYGTFTYVDNIHSPYVFKYDEVAFNDIDERKDLYEGLKNKYKEKQVIVAIEELSELQKELCKALRGKGNREALLDELADSTIMLEQMKEYFDIQDVEIIDRINEKIERTRNRMNGGNI